MQNQLLRSEPTKLDHFIPSLTLMGLIILTHAWPTAHFEVIPDFALILVYYWSVFRANFVLVSSLFVIGLLEDILVGTFLGTTPLIWLITYFATQTQRKYLLERKFLMIWVGFTFVALVAYTTKALTLYYSADMLPSFKNTAFSYLLTVLFYPVLAKFISPLNKYSNV